MMQLAVIGIATLLILIGAIHWSTSLLVQGKGSGDLRTTLMAIAYLLIGGGIAIPIIVVPWVLLGGDEKAGWLIALVFFGTAAHELTDISGAVKTSRYQMAKSRITARSRNRCAARWNIFWWVSGAYRDAFLEKLPRFWFRIAAWSLLAAAAILLTNISSTCETDAKDTSRPAAAVEVAADPAPVALPLEEEELDDPDPVGD